VLGAIAGDVIGSRFEWANVKTKDFSLLTDDCIFTDDTVLAVALADAILTGANYGHVMKAYYKRYPFVSYGGRFREWARSDDIAPYSSWGNGAAMRISPAAYAYDTLEEVLRHAARFTGTTHDHPEGIKGGRTTAAAIFIARAGGSKAEIRSYVAKTFGYDLSATVDSIRPTYVFDESCQGTVPQALICFLESVACIAGAVAEGFYGGVPEHIAEEVMGKLDSGLRETTARFMQTHVRVVR